MYFMISGNKLFSILYISVEDISRFLWWTVTDFSLERSSINDEKWSFYYDLIMFFYYDLSVCQKLLKVLDNMQIASNAFMVILSFFQNM